MGGWRRDAAVRCLMRCDREGSESERIEQLLREGPC